MSLSSRCSVYGLAFLFSLSAFAMTEEEEMKMATQLSLESQQNASSSSVSSPSFLEEASGSDSSEAELVQKERKTWETFGRAFFPFVEPYLHQISKQLFQYLSKNEPSEVTHSLRNLSDPDFGINDAIQNTIAGAVHADEAELKAAYAYKDWQTLEEVSLPFPPQTNLENRWYARQRVAFDILLQQLIIGTLLKEEILDAKNQAHIYPKDTAIPVPHFQTLVDQWLAEPSLRFEETQIALEREAENKEIDDQEANELSYALGESLKLSQIEEREKSRKNEVLSLLASSSVSSNLSLEQAGELLRQQFARTQGVNLQDPSPAIQKRIQRILQMPLEELIEISRRSQRLSRN